MATATEYDLIVIGSGPGGQKAAVAAAKLGKTVAVVEHGHMLGGVCVNTGTIPSKTLREAVLHLTGMNQRELYGASYRVKEKITPADLQERTSHVIKREVDVIRDQLVRNHIDLFTGHGSFLDANTVRVEGPIEAEHRTLTGEFIVIATGTTPRRPDGVDFDDERVLDSDEIVNLDFIPTSMVVVGAGVIGPRTSSTTTTPWSTESKSRVRRRSSSAARPSRSRSTSSKTSVRPTCGSGSAPCAGRFW